MSQRGREAMPSSHVSVSSSSWGPGGRGMGRRDAAIIVGWVIFDKIIFDWIGGWCCYGGELSSSGRTPWLFSWLLAHFTEL